MPASGPLTLLPLLRATPTAQGQVLVTRKFLDGLALYRKYWPGPVQALLEPEPRLGHDLDHVAVDPRRLPFGLKLVSYASPRLADELARSALVLGGPDYRIPRLAELCRALDVPCVYNTEYTLRTRLQIARIEERRPLRLLKRSLWEANQERLIRQTLPRVAGVQCNGAPTFARYSKLSPKPLLYFDTRADLSLFARDEELTARLVRVRDGAPLTLAFSGRLHPVKGADHLLDVAAALARLGVRFRMLIAGDGPCAAPMRERIAREGLTQVVMLGVLDFRRELMPLMRREVDLFVSCHRQGDPSCTYLETFAAGVPVAGYANEAFAGLLSHDPGLGFRAPLDRPEQLARRIAQVPREELVQKSWNCLRFARQHDFESTFARRIAHLVQIAGDWRERHDPVPDPQVVGSEALP